MRSRKMKPYCLTSDKRIDVSYIPHYSGDNTYLFHSEIKTLRKQRAIERRYEKKQTRQRSKQLIKKQLLNI